MPGFAQMVMTFNETEADELLRAIEVIAALNHGGNKTAAAKLLIRAGLGDPVAQAAVQALSTMREMKDFTEAAAPVALEAC